MPAAKAVALSKVAGAGDRRASLEALRQVLAAAIDADPAPRDLAALSRQLSEVLAVLDSLPVAKGASVVNDLAARRAKRRSTASGS